MEQISALQLLDQIVRYEVLICGVSRNDILKQVVVPRHGRVFLADDCQVSVPSETLLEAGKYYFPVHPMKALARCD